MAKFFELTPAYSDYKTGKDVKAAWAAGKDFRGDYNLNFAIVNIQDIPKPATVLLRYKGNTSVVSVNVK